MPKNIIKRNGEIVPFNIKKISEAIIKSMKYGSGIIKPKIAEFIALEIENEETEDTIDISVVEEKVYTKLIEKKQKMTAKAYEGYRAVREFQRDINTIDNKILGIIKGTNIESLQSNSNKQPDLNATQRDLVTEEVSKDIASRIMLPPHIVQAHNDGLIYIHDLGHYLNKSFNCCLVNLKDMLENGTVINGKMVEKPHSFRTACTIATQIIAQVASGQFGGQTISLAHLSPFVRISETKIRKDVEEELRLVNLYDMVLLEDVEKIVQKRLLEEVKSGIQTFQYQINTLQTSNGQAPFLSVFMYISEYPEYEKETVMLISEMLTQRIQGMKNEAGAWITPAFPKLLYVTDENNIKEDSEYYWLTKLSSVCVSKRMMPDFISAKHMKENYEGNVFGCMGCVEGSEVVTYKIGEDLYVESFERMWDRVRNYHLTTQQYIGSKNLFVNLEQKNIKIYDAKNGFVQVSRLIRNISNKWVNIRTSGGRVLTCTEDHPFPTGRGRVQAKDLNVEDIVTISNTQHSLDKYDFDHTKAWLLGFILCDGCYSGGRLFSSIAAQNEDDIEQYYIKAVKDNFELESNVIIQQRGVNGHYKDISSFGGNNAKVISYLTYMYEGINKKNRHIPNEVFMWSEESRLAFLAGMIDADGYINNSDKVNKAHGCVVQIGSTNKELSLQQMSLAQSLGMNCKIYINHYSKANQNLVRYRVEFVPSELLIEYIVCEKKKEHYVKKAGENIYDETTTVKITSTEAFSKEMFSYDVTTSSDHFDVSGIYSHNCRAWLSPYKDENNDYVWYGRFNMGLTSLNLADVGLSAEKNIEQFWNILDDRLALCKESLILRYEKLKNITSDVSPIHWQHGAIARLPKHTPVFSLLQNGYATISLGYIGLYECIKSLTGKSHTTNDGETLALEIMEHLKSTILKWKKETGLGFALYGTPSESLTERFAQLTRNRWGIIDGITDRDYLTNSYHVFVQEPINAFDKLKFESQFHSISSGGAISYIETPNMSNNTDAIMTLIQYMYDNVQYAEFNTKLDYCMACGYEGEIICGNDLEWYCPNCGNRDKGTMNVCRRTCGYLGENFWNKGRTQEIKERVLHI